MKPVLKSHKLAHVSYDIRGPVMQQAEKLEAAGQKIIKLNIGNVGAFAFDAPQDIRNSMSLNLQQAAAYSESKGILAAREAIARYAAEKKIRGVAPDDVYIGNGVSELIVMAMNGLLNPGDEVLVPAPDYPLWTAAVCLSGGTAVHYLCDEQSGWLPDIADIRAKITPNARAIVMINPNNPTGAVYPESLLHEIVAVAREFGLILYADEVYDKVLYDGTQHTSIASLCEDVPIFTFNGLSKNHRACGYRAGWMIISGDRCRTADYIDGLEMLASMRLCANVPAQFGIKAALEGYPSINDLVAPGGRLCRQRDLSHAMLTAIPGVTCVKPKGTMYMFPRLDPVLYPVEDDEAFILEFLREQQVLLVHGTGFNWPGTDHFRLVFLPQEEMLKEAISRLACFLDGYRKRYGT